MTAPRQYFDHATAVALARVVRAALDQRAPSPALRDALNEYLTLFRHPLAPVASPEESRS